MYYKNIFYILTALGISFGILLSIIINYYEPYEPSIEDNKLRKKIPINPSEKENNTLVNNIEHLNQSNPNIVPISISIDNNYIYPALVFLTSLLENINPTTKYELYILTPNDFTQENIDKLNKLVIKYTNKKININYINMESLYVPYVPDSYVSGAAYYKLYLPELLPDIDKLLYLDVDMINFKDLSELYNFNFEDNIFIKGILDHFSHTEELLKYDINIDKYINSGTLLIDLKNIRLNGIDKELIKFINTYSYRLEHHDQTTINAVCYKNIGILPIKYAIFNYNTISDLYRYNNEQVEKYRVSREEIEEAYYHPYLIHYAGVLKPWSDREIKYGEYWWYYAKKSIFYEEILEFYEMSDDIVLKMIKNILK